MKYLSYLLFLLFFSAVAQQNQYDRSDLINRERAGALRRMLRQPMANTGNYDVKYHRLELSPSMNSRLLSGIVTTYFVPNQNLSSIEFDFTSQMSVQSVTQRGNSLSFSQQNDVLTVNFSTPATNGVLDSIKITYSGNVPDTGLGSYAVSNHNGVPVVWTLSEPYGAKDWWPCKQDLNDKIDSIDITLTYDKYAGSQSLVGVSNGILDHEMYITPSGGGMEKRISYWKHRYPIAAYLVAFAVTNYSKFSQTAGVVQNFPIDNYVYPENLSLAQAQSSSFVPVMNYFEQSFGHYPFNNEKYGQIQFGWGGGMEHQTATFVTSYQRWLIAHELAHQWFGDAITCGSWHDIWLNEGFATYSEALTREALDGTAAFDSWKQSVIFDIISEPGGSVYVQDTTDIWRIFDGRLSYRKGAMVLNMLRLKTGDNNFFQGLKNYVNHKSFQYAMTNDFRTEMENQSGLDLQEFFNDWIYGQGYPTYNITVSRVGINQFEVIVNQSTSHSSVPFFEMPLPFSFTDNQGNTFDIILDNTQNNQHFVVDVGFEATAVTFDKHFDIVKGNSSVNQYMGINTIDEDTFKIYPNPADKFIRIDNLSNQSIENISLVNLAGRKIETFAPKDNIFDISKVSKGIYLLQIKTDKKTFIKKLIVD